MQYLNKTSYTSDPIQIGVSGISGVWFACTDGTVSIEILEEDGVWRSYPETTFTDATAQVVAVPQGYIRVVIDASSAVNVTIKP